MAKLQTIHQITIMTLNQTDRQLITTRNEGITGIQLLKIDIDTNWKYPVLYNFG